MKLIKKDKQENNLRVNYEYKTETATVSLITRDDKKLVFGSYKLLVFRIFGAKCDGLIGRNTINWSIYDELVEKRQIHLL